MRSRSRTFIAATLCLATFAACTADHATAVPFRTDLVAPDAPAATTILPTSTSTMATTATTNVRPLHRVARLGAPVSVTQTIGSAGGTLSIPLAGVTVTVPMGALSAPVSIRMTALAGDAVAYEFAPHGLVFAKPLVIKQQLGGTIEKGPYGTRLSTPLELGYFRYGSQVTSSSASVEQLRGGNESGDVFTSTISHFSGYAVSCGRQ
jgi:hypothetical protein